MALNYQPPQRRQEDTSGLVNSLDRLFNAYTQGKGQAQQQALGLLQLQGARNQLQNSQREQTLAGIQDTAQFGAPLTSYTPQQIQQAGRPAPMIPQTPGFMQQPQESFTQNLQRQPLVGGAPQEPMMAGDDGLGHLRAGLEQIKSSRKLKTDTDQAGLRKELGQARLAEGQAGYFESIAGGGGKPTTQNIGGVEYLVKPTPRGPDYSPIPERIPTQSENIARGYADKATEANTALDTLIQSGFTGTSLSAGAQSMLPNFMQSGKVQGLENAKKMFGNAIARRESGATIKDDEMARYNATYFPQAGDSPELLTQKKRNRDLAIASLATEGHRVKSQIQPQGGIETRTLKDGSQVRVKRLPDGSFEEVP